VNAAPATSTISTTTASRPTTNSQPGTRP
jgi:hypothetical protein